jgi:hypothetical protein
MSALPNWPLVVIESPCRGRVPAWVPFALAPLFERIGRWRNHRYALRCVRDSLARGEAPYASHVLFDRRGLLDDADPKQRASGLLTGLLWGAKAELRAVYCDRGVSVGMALGVLHRPSGQGVDYRWLDRSNGCSACGVTGPHACKAPPQEAAACKQN